MMNALFTKTFFPAYLLIGYSLSSGINSSILAQSQAPTVIPVALPDTVTVQLKSGVESSGVHLLEIDSKKQQLKLEQSDREYLQDITSVERITFKGKTIIKGGEIVIRGEDQKQGRCGNQEDWKLPLSHVKVTDSKEGKAEVNLSSMPNGKRREITQRSQTSTFVVKEIQFSSPGQTTLIMAPCQAK